MQKNLLQKTIRFCLLIVVILSAKTSWAQTTLVNYDFNSGGSYTALTPTRATNVTSVVTSSEAFATFAGIATTTAAFTQNSTPGQGIAMNNSSGNNTKYFQFQLGGSALSTYSDYKIYYQAQRSGTGASTLKLSYSTNGTSYTDFPSTGSPGNGSYSEITADLSTITAINKSTNLYFRLYASGASGNGTLRVDNFQVSATPAPAVVAPTVTTAAATAVATNSVTLGGNVTNNGGTTLTARGVIYSATATTPTTATGTTVNNGAATGAYTANISGLAVNTRYYFRAYATNSAGTSYGTVGDFYTLANVPSMPTLSGITSSTIDVTIGENANNATTKYVIRVNGNSYVDASGAFTASETQLAAPGGTPLTVKGLASNTDYTFEVKAINSANVSTAYSTFIKGTTLTSTAPVLVLKSSDLAFNTICTNTSLTKSFVFSGANLEANASVVLFPLDGYTYSATENGTFTSTLTITNYNGGDITVWVKFTPAVVQSYNGTISLAAPGGAALSVPVTAQSINTPATVATGAASDITGLTATLVATITANGCTDVTVYGVEYSLTNNFANGSGTQVVSGNINSGAFSIALSNLSPGATYYYKAYATNAGGTVYGTQQLFTTLIVETPITTAATNIEQTSFTANWTAVNGATGYRLDVSTSPDFSSAVAGKTVTESFNNVINPGASSSYSTVTWTDSNNIGWTSYKTRTDQVVSDDYAITLRDQADSYLLSNEITGGLVNIKFDVKQVFTGSTGKLTISVLTGSDFTTEKIIGTHTITTDITTYNSGAIADVIGSYKIKVSNDAAVRPAIDNLIYTTAPSSTNFMLDGYNNLDVNNVTSYNVTGINPFTTYYYRVRAFSANSTSANSNVTSLTTKVDAVTWAVPTGSTVASWQPVQYPDGTLITMDVTINAVIAANYNTKTNGTFVAKSITMQSGIFTIATGTTLTVEGGVINNTGAANFVVENNAALLQNTTVNNTGAITVVKNTNPLYRLDYTMWSAPVFGLTLGDFSPKTAQGRFYEYKYDLDIATGTNIESYFTVDPSTTFGPAKSYLVRMPNSSPVVGYDTGDIAIPFNAAFVGKPNNGTITTALSTSGNKYTAIGNPYASPISLVDFFGINKDVIDIASGIYMWRKKNDSEASTYATLNLSTYVANDAIGGGDDQKDFFTGDNNSWILSQGQGFIVKTADGVANPSVTFNNGMRRAAPESGDQPILRPATTPASRLWLNLTNNSKAFSQTAIAYIDGTTKGLDYGYDATRFVNQESVSLFSLVADNKLAIQARSSFDVTDVVALGFVANNAGTYTINLDRADGLFSTSQDIYIKDNLLGVTQNIKEGAYTFTTEKGVFTNRFEIRYNKTTLDVNNPDLDANSVIVYKQDDVININSATAAITNVTVYDVRGRKLYNNNTINATNATVNGLTAQQQVLIIEVTTLKGKVSKKIIF